MLKAIDVANFFKNERASRYRTRRLFRCILGWRNKKRCLVKHWKKDLVIKSLVIHELLWVL